MDRVFLLPLPHVLLKFEDFNLPQKCAKHDQIYGSKKIKIEKTNHLIFITFIVYQYNARNR